MDEKGLGRIIGKGENQAVEFKSKADDGVGKSICSFANTNDGIILVGVDDKGNVEGINKKHEREIANIAHSCKPSVYPEVIPVEIKGKNVFVVKVKKSDSLHSFKNISYKRIASHDKPLSPEEVIE
ncbi:MAG: RNA-binding domain-containing protein, partial [Candidatus Woesearchaeota archaeon]